MSVRFAKTYMISIHAPTRGATALSSIVQLILSFQSTLPREERQFHLRILRAHHQYFNPRSHERSDQMYNGIQSTYKISIHAPTRGATTADSKDCCKLNISIHAPTRGATEMRRAILHSLQFQSTLPREERQSCVLVLQLVNSISIHAPTRGATLDCRLKLSALLFQSTLPREERRSLCFESLSCQVYFNPRSHERSDPVAFAFLFDQRISIHAPTRGAT